MRIIYITDFASTIEGINHYILFDDFAYFAYSGSQLSGILERNPKPIISILVGVSSIANRLISEKAKDKHYYGIEIKTFEDMYEDGTIDPLIYKGLQYFFRPMTDLNVSVYFDHKIADHVSTVANIVKFGPIIPSYYDPSVIASLSIATRSNEKIIQKSKWINDKSGLCNYIIDNEIKKTEDDITRDDDLDNRLVFINTIDMCRDIDVPMTDNLSSYYALVFQMDFIEETAFLHGAIGNEITIGFIKDVLEPSKKNIKDQIKNGIEVFETNDYFYDSKEHLEK